MIEMVAQIVADTRSEEARDVALGLMFVMMAKGWQKEMYEGDNQEDRGIHFEYPDRYQFACAVVAVARGRHATHRQPPNTVCCAPLDVWGDDCVKATGYTAADLQATASRIYLQTVNPLPTSYSDWFEPAGRVLSVPPVILSGLSVSESEFKRKPRHDYFLLAYDNPYDALGRFIVHSPRILLWSRHMESAEDLDDEPTEHSLSEGRELHNAVF
jgi:hypothetical protein